jgi:hypothetical protein
MLVLARARARQPDCAEPEPGGAVLKPSARQRSQAHPALSPVGRHIHRLKTAVRSGHARIPAEHPGHIG